MKKIRSASLKIGKVIHEQLRDLISNYPIIAPQNTTYPFAVYKRTGLQVADTKDIYNYEENANVEIIIVSQSYDESLELATNVKMYLEHLKGSFKTSKNEIINISDITLIDTNEDFNNDAYLQIMIFRISIENESDIN